MPIPQAAHYMNCPLHELPITGVLLYFQLGKGPSRGLLRDCEIFVNLNYKLSPSLLSPPVVWPRGENMMKPWVWIWRVKVSSNIAYRSGPATSISHLRYNTDFFLRCAVYQPPWCAAPGHGSGEVRQLCVQSLVAYLLGPSWTKFKKGGRGVFNIEFRWQ